MKKYIFIALIALGFSTAGCRKPQPDYMSKGIITGPDYRKCACCGGWFITIDNNEYIFSSVPSGSNLDLQNEEFPVKVELDWKKIQEPCANRIEVARIRKQ